jgi:thiol-disulfide isomerase/thioredoxin
MPSLRAQKAGGAPAAQKAAAQKAAAQKAAAQKPPRKSRRAKAAGVRRAAPTFCPDASMSQQQPQPQTRKPVVTAFASRAQFLQVLASNPGLVVVKFGAAWCAPCQRVLPVVDAFFATSPDDVLCCDIDVDESFDAYAFLKSKKMVSGVPALLCYARGNASFIPDDSVSGADPAALDAFFQRCGALLRRARALRGA